MRENDYNLLIEKAEELRSLFILGQKVIPFLEDIFQFLKETQPLFEEINASISENVQKMPSASEQLSRVSMESEKTTNQIMDEVDDIIQNASKIIQSNKLNTSTSPVKILTLLKDAILEGKNLQPTVPMLEKAISFLTQPENENLDEQGSTIEKFATDIQHSANSIMMSLQIQDITSQQLASVDHLLKNLQQRMQLILNKFSNDDIEVLSTDLDTEVKANVSELHRTVSFDPEAINNYNNANKQSEIDTMFAEANSKTDLSHDYTGSGEPSQDSEDSFELDATDKISNDDIDSEQTESPTVNLSPDTFGTDKDSEILTEESTQRFTETSNTDVTVFSDEPSAIDPLDVDEDNLEHLVEYPDSEDRDSPSVEGFDQEDSTLAFSGSATESDEASQVGSTAGSDIQNLEESSAGSDTDTKFTQDDIDAMFGG